MKMISRVLHALLRWAFGARKMIGTREAWLFFDIDDEGGAYQHCCALQGASLRSVAWDLEQELRTAERYPPDTAEGEVSSRYAAYWRDRLRNLLADEGIDLYVE